MHIYLNAEYKDISKHLVLNYIFLIIIFFYTSAQIMNFIILFVCFL